MRGTLYIADTVVQRVDPRAGMVTIVAGNGTLPSRLMHVHSGRRLSARQIPLEPVALATGPAGDLYIADDNIGLVRWQDGNR
jgi:hypothetical protein